MPQFTRRALQPMRPSSYRAAARKLRRVADLLEARAEAADPRAKQALTRAIHGLAHFAHALSRRHRGIPLYAPVDDD